MPPNPQEAFYTVKESQNKAPNIILPNSQTNLWVIIELRWGSTHSDVIFIYNINSLPEENSYLGLK